jgi:hypothetical protein
MARIARKTDEPALATVDARSAPRITLTLRTAKLVAPDCELLCVLRDVSRTGFKARLFHPLPDESRFVLDVGNDTQFTVEAVWEDDGHAGFQFAQGPVDLDALLAEHGRFPRRHLRLNLAAPVLLWFGNESRQAAVRNISQSGAMVIADAPLPVGARLVLAEPHLGEVAARVCWRRHLTHGLVFASPFRFDELASLADRLRRDSDLVHDPAESLGEASP